MNSDDEAARAAAAAAARDEAHERVGHRGDDAGEDDQRRAVADARFGDELAEPHDDDGAGRQREHRHEAEAEARDRATTSAPPFERLSTYVAMNHACTTRDDDRAVAGELVDPAPALLAFFVELVELGHDDREQLHHDRRRHVRHDAEREDRQLLQRAAREHVEHAEERAGAALGHDVAHLDAVDARDRDEHADPVDGEHRQREQDPPPELRNLRDIAIDQPVRPYAAGGR